MSQALFEHGGLRFWNENEIELRELFIQRSSSVVKRTLLNLNPAFKIARCEGPILHPREQISSSYDEDDIFVTNHKGWALRAETTPSSYAYAKSLRAKLPLCIWQAGISSRREKSDGASASKLRFNNFWQLEFQCIYSDTTKADYRKALMDEISKEIKRFTQKELRVVDSDRLPSYSLSTLDIECLFNDRWTEVASCSIRNDYQENCLVAEIALGLDRIVTMSA
jgi:glycyl-tRNA synthetase